MSKNSLVSMIRYFVSNHLYISLDTLKDYLAEKNIEFKSQVLNQTVHRLVKSGDIYDAGQGWYSSIENPYRLNRTPVEPLASQLEKQFALQEFSVWSTRQIRSHYHHLPGKFVTFIYAEKNTEDAVYDYLSGELNNVYQDPDKKEVKKQFRLEKDTYVVRTVIQDEPKDNHFATIEKILVDLFVEKDRLNLINVFEFNQIFTNIAGGNRINIASLLSYAKKRNRKDLFRTLVEGISTL